MTEQEQELREKIAKWLFTFVCERESLILDWEQIKGYYLQEADNFIKEALPELAKETGYVKLAKDQRVPENPYPLRNTMLTKPQNIEPFEEGKRVGYGRCQADMLKQGWKRVVDNQKPV